MKPFRTSFVTLYIVANYMKFMMVKLIAKGGHGWTNTTTKYEKTT